MQYDDVLELIGERQTRRKPKDRRKFERDDLVSYGYEYTLEAFIEDDLDDDQPRRNREAEARRKSRRDARRRRGEDELDF